MDFFETALYKNALRQVKFRMEEAAKRNVEIFGNAWYKDHFRVNPTPHTVSEFDTILGNSTLAIAASTINGKSAEPLRAFDGFSSIAQKMFTHAHAYRLDADEIRELMVMSKTLGEKQVLNYIVDKLFNVTKRAVDGVRARLDIIILEALKNDGVFTFSASNDPGSPFVGQSIYFGFNSSHAGTVGSGNTWVDANLATVDPLVEITSVCDQADVQFEKILISKADLYYILKTAKMKAYINTVQTVNAPLTPVQLNNFMTSLGLPTFEIVQRKCRVQDGNDFTEYQPFGTGKLVFLPKNEIGSIETRLSDAELGLVSPGVEYSHYGRIEVANYKMGEKENTSYTEITKARLTAAPSMDTIADMYTLDVTQ